jgi:hypothetical protein
VAVSATLQQTNAKKYFCVQKNQAITSELSEILFPDLLRHKTKMFRPSGLKEKSGLLDEEPL